MSKGGTRGEGRKSGGIAYPLIITCFFFSGAAGLIYEVVWARQLSLFLGITSFAHTAVITAYMVGLAAGSLNFGRRADEVSNPLVLYARLEVGIGLYAAFTPWIFNWLQTAYAGMAGMAGISGMGGHLSRFAIAMLLLLIPTFLMGGTLPLLVRGFVRRLPEIGKATSRLYGINTLGAMSGTLLAGYLLLPKLGIVVAILTGVIMNLAIAVVVLRLARSNESRPGLLPTKDEGEDSHDEPQSEPLCAAVRLSVLIGFGLAGFASLLTQLAWIRALILVIGGSVYAFTITLASFLAGIGLGSLLYARFLANREIQHPFGKTYSRLRTAAVMSLAIALSILLGLPLLAKLPEWFLEGFQAAIAMDFAVFQLFVFSLSFLVMIVPTVFMGALFPLVTVLWTSSTRRAGQGVGTAFAINTSGTILGALLGGILILPWLGVHHSIVGAASIYMVVALLFWTAADHPRGRFRQLVPIVVFGSVFAATLFMLPSWNKMLMASGVYYRAHITAEQLKDRSLEEIISDSELLYYAEGLDGTVTVKRQGGDRYLAVNGKTDASSRGDLPTQILLGQLPLQMNRDIRNAMVIGLGSGITAGTVARDKNIESITVLEISNEVVEASHFFDQENYSVLDDPRVELITADARNFLLASQQSYDLIVSEPSNPWISGISNLFTSEFFELASSRLTPAGVMAQWFHTYSMSEHDFRTVLRSFSDQFEYVSVWRTLPGDLVLIGSQQEHAIALDRAKWLAKDNPVSKELRRAGVSSDSGLLDHFVISGESLKQYVRGARLNSDRHPVVEFNAPRNLYSATEHVNMNSVYRFLNDQSIAVPVLNLIELDDQQIQAPALGISVRFNEAVNPEIISKQWLHAWLRDEQGAEVEFRQASLGVLRWREAGQEYYLQSGEHAQAASQQVLAENLRALIPAQIRQSGETIMPDGSVAAWLWSSDGSAANEGFAGLAWNCEGGDETYRQFVLIFTLPEAVEPVPGDHLESIKGRLICQ